MKRRKVMRCKIENKTNSSYISFLIIIIINNIVESIYKRLKKKTRMFELLTE